MLYRRKRALLLFLIILILSLLAGCSSSPDSNNVVINDSGNLYVEVQIPSELVDTQLQAVTDGITLDYIEMTVSKEGKSDTKQASVSGDSVSLSFSELEVGTWAVEVEATDNNGYQVYSGSADAVVENNKENTVEVGLELLPADLDLSVDIPSDLDVASGEVILVNPLPEGENFSKNLSIDGEQGIASFTDIPANEWHIEINLYNSNYDLIDSYEDDVTVLPGRLNEVSITPEGSLTVNTDWEVAPESPSGLIAGESNGDTVLNWDSNPEDNIEGYAVYRSKKQDGEKSLLTTTLISETTYTDTEVESGSTYWYWVRAYNTQGLAGDLSTGISIDLSPTIQPIAKYSFSSTEDKSITIPELGQTENAIIGLTPLVMDPNNNDDYQGTIEVTGNAQIVSNSIHKASGQTGDESQIAEIDKKLRQWENEFEVPENFHDKYNALAESSYNLGDTRDFYVYNFSADNYYQITAEVEVIGDNCYIFVDQNYSLNKFTLDLYTDEFDQQIFPTNMDYFANNSYGTGYYDYDKNDKCIILFTLLDDNPDDGLYMGYFDPRNYYDPSSLAYSNGADMMYINTYAAENGEDNNVFSTIAHEFQHLLFFVEKKFYAERNVNDTWINEGFSGLAEYINGYYSYTDDRRIYDDSGDQGFFNYPAEESLLYWDYNLSDYGASNLFSLYLYDKFGRQLLNNVISSPENPIEVISSNYRDFSDLYLDWITTNYVYDNNQGEEYTYPVDLNNKPRYQELSSSSNFSIKASAQKYYLIEGNGGDVQLNIDYADSLGVMIYRY